MNNRLKYLFLLIILVIIIIFVIQNYQLITIVIFNRPLGITFSLGIWVVIFIIAGILTSLFLKLLNPTQIIPIPDNYISSSTTAKKPKPSNENLDYEDEWNIEEPPMESTTIKNPYSDQEREARFNEKSRKNSIKKPRNTDNKPPQKKPPSNVEKNKSSNTKKITPPSEKRIKNNNQKQKNKNGVYDADYRVITPPYKKNKQNSEESWTDDDFDF